MRQGTRKDRRSKGEGTVLQLQLFRSYLAFIFFFAFYLFLNINLFILIGS